MIRKYKVIDGPIVVNARYEENGLIGVREISYMPGDVIELEEEHATNRKQWLEPFGPVDKTKSTTKEEDKTKSTTKKGNK